MKKENIKMYRIEYFVTTDEGNIIDDIFLVWAEDAIKALEICSQVKRTLIYNIHICED